MDKKQAKKFEDFFGVEIIQTSIANSSLIGILVKGNSNGFIVPKIIEEEEKKRFKEQGIKFKEIKSEFTSIGNLLALNDSIGIASELFSNKVIKEMEKFLKTKLIKKNLANNYLTGANLVITGKGFIVNPNISEKEFKFLEKTLNLKGMATTINYGDQFVSNSLIANSFGIFAGKLSTGFEMLRVDESLNK